MYVTKMEQSPIPLSILVHWIAQEYDRSRTPGKLPSRLVYDGETYYINIPQMTYHTLNNKVSYSIDEVLCAGDEDESGELVEFRACCDKDSVTYAHLSPDDSYPRLIRNGIAINEYLIITYKDNDYSQLVFYQRVNLPSPVRFTAIIVGFIILGLALAWM